MDFKILFLEQPNSESNKVVSEAPLISENSTHYSQSQNERKNKDSEAERDIGEIDR